jgi:uncharacterized membrane protein YhaH (DUF805 family)
MNILIRPWAHYADFEGRSRRTEYFLFHLSFWVVLVAVIAVMAVVVRPEPMPDPEAPPSAAAMAAGAFLMLFYMAAIVPSIAVTVRRAHDMDQSGWMVLLLLVPLVGFIYGLVLLFGSGTEGENDYGWDPRDGEPERDPDDLIRAPRQVATVSRSTER